MPTATRPRPAAVLLAVVVLLLSACGDDDGTAAGSTTSSTTTTTTTTSTTTPSTTTASSTTTAPPTAEPPIPVGEPRTTAYETPGFPATGPPALLDDVTVAAHPPGDRIVFDFGPDEPDPSVRVAPVEGTPRMSPSGRPVDLEGGHVVAVTMTPASGVDLSGPEPVVTYDGPQRFDPTDTTVLRSLVSSEDFESTTTWLLGLEQPAPIGVAVLSGDGEGTRVVVDVVATTTAKEVTLNAVDAGARDFSVVTYLSEGGRCVELRLPTDATPGRDAVECGPPTGILDVRVLRDGDVAAIAGFVTDPTVDDVDLIANDGSAIAEDLEGFSLVDLGAGVRGFAAPDDPAFVSAVVARSGVEEVARVELP